MKLTLANNAETLLAGAINETATTVLLSPGTGIKFPQLDAGEFFPLTLVKTSGGVAAREIVYVTARSVDSCTVLRAQEGTTATAFSSGDYAGCHSTAGCFGAKADLAGAVFTGPVSMPGAAITGAVDMADNVLSQAVLKDCAEAFGSASANIINIATGGKVQTWAPGTGAQTLTITGWPATGHGELLIYGTNLGAATITIAGNPVSFINGDGTHTKSNSLNANHGATLQAVGLDFVFLWSPDGGVTRYCKVVR